MVARRSSRGSGSSKPRVRRGTRLASIDDVREGAGDEPSVQALLDARSGVRYAISRGALYDKTDDLPVTTGYLDRKKGRLPYGNHRNVSGTQTDHSYRTRIDLSVVLKTRRDSSTRHPERWIDSGKHCRVKTTQRNGDTLGCELGDSL
jgi:hypothetical protein